MGNRGTARIVVLIGCYGMALVETSAAAHGGTTDAGPLRDLASQCGIWIGPAVAYGPLIGEPIYADTLGGEFSILTPENEMKMGGHPSAAISVQLRSRGHPRRVRRGE